jgi:glutathione S-transferase
VSVVAIVAALALLEYSWFATQVGNARARYGVKAPATTGNEIFERYYRVQQNTVEQLVAFLPALFLFATYVSAAVAAALGALFIAGRWLYARGYVADPEKRSTGFLIGAVASTALLIGGLLGAIWSLL